MARGSCNGINYSKEQKGMQLSMQKGRAMNKKGTRQVLSRL